MISEANDRDVVREIDGRAARGGLRETGRERAAEEREALHRRALLEGAVPGLGVLGARPAGAENAEGIAFLRLQDRAEIFEDAV